MITLDALEQLGAEPLDLITARPSKGSVTDSAQIAFNELFAEWANPQPCSIDDMPQTLAVLDDTGGADKFVTTRGELM